MKEQLSFVKALLKVSTKELEAIKEQAEKSKDHSLFAVVARILEERARKQAS